MARRQSLVELGSEMQSRTWVRLFAVRKLMSEAQVGEL